jgi:hypothetical protein
MCLTPRDAKLLVRFLDAVDSNVTARLLPDTSVDERHLTSTLRETLDERFTHFHSLTYNMDQLKADLAADDTTLKVSLRIEAKEYPPRVEHRLTQTDLGIIIRYDNHFRTGESFAKAALFQAKRLYGSARRESRYSERDAFQSLDGQQLLRIIELSEKYSDLLYYLFYCPRPEAYDDYSRAALRHLTIPILPLRHHHPLHWIEEFGFLSWWTHLTEYASDPARHFPGLLASKIYWLRERYFDKSSAAGATSRWVAKPKVPALSVRELYERLWNDVYALSWFLVYGMMMGYDGSAADAALGLARGDEMSQELGLAPRYTMELRITVGGEG